MACHDNVNAGPGGKRYNYYYSETAPLVHYSGTARGDDAMASRQIYAYSTGCIYNAPKSIITLTVRVSLTSRVTIETGQKYVPQSIYAQ